LNAMALCLALAIAPLVPPRPDASGWHMLAGPVVHDGDLRPVAPEKWFWDAALRVWRLRPDAFLADTPQQMACDEYRYVSPAEEAANGPAVIVDIGGPPGAPPLR
jgi:hypothetical protein